MKCTKVFLADAGSTDGTPQAAVERYPNARLFNTGANLGYGTAVNRAIEHLSESGQIDDWVLVANPDVQWGPNSIDALLEAATRWPQAGALGPLIRDPDGSVVTPQWTSYALTPHPRCPICNR